jgi:hypothetical protein
MGFSKFLISTNGIIAFRRGVFGLDSAEAGSKGHSVLDRWSRTHANFGAPFKLIYFRQYFIYKCHYTNRSI